MEFNIGIVTFYIIICVVGLIGNLLAILTIIFLKEYKKSVTHWYVLQLSIADMIFLLTIPFKVTESIENAWNFLSWLCSAKETILFLNYYASILFLIIMSVDRYMAVCHPFSEVINKLRKMKPSLLITLITWVIAFLLTLPIMLNSAPSGLQPNCQCRTGFPSDNSTYDRCVELSHGDPYLLKTVCDGLNANVVCYKSRLNASSLIAADKQFNASESSGDYTIYDYNTPVVPERTNGPPCNYFKQPNTWVALMFFNFVVMFCLPVLIMSVFYGLIVRHLFNNIVTGNASQSSTSQSANSRRRVTKICAALVLTFVLSWILFHAVHLAKLNGIRLPDSNCVLLTDISVALAYLNSALNPFLYSCMGSNYARKRKLLLESRFGKFVFSKRQKTSSKTTQKAKVTNTSNNLKVQQNIYSSQRNPSPSSGITGTKM